MVVDHVNVPQRQGHLRQGHLWCGSAGALGHEKTTICQKSTNQIQGIGLLMFTVSFVEFFLRFNSCRPTLNRNKKNEKGQEVK